MISARFDICDQELELAVEDREKNLKQISKEIEDKLVSVCDDIKLKSTKIKIQTEIEKLLQDLENDIKSASYEKKKHKAHILESLRLKQEIESWNQYMNVFRIFYF